MDGTRFTPVVVLAVALGGCPGPAAPTDAGTGDLDAPGLDAPGLDSASSTDAPIVVTSCADVGRIICARLETCAPAYLTLFYGGSLADKWILTAGLGGMGGAQPLAATMAGASMLAIECQQSRIDMRLATRYLDRQAADLDEALRIVGDACAQRRPVSVGLLGNAAEILPELARRAASGGPSPHMVTDQTSAHDLVNGYLPAGWSVERWRAAQKAGLMRVPVVVREVADGQDRSLLEMALVENIQRENLNPIDEALAYRRLSDEFRLTQEEIASAVGKDRASIANFQRLLRLPLEVQADVASGTLSMGHARALLALASESDQRSVARDVIARNLSVRETEALVRKASEGAKPKEAPAPKPVDVHTRAAEDRLRLALGTRVRIVRQGTRGRIEIDFGSEDELIRIYDQLTQ